MTAPHLSHSPGRWYKWPQMDMVATVPWLAVAAPSPRPHEHRIRQSARTGHQRSLWTDKLSIICTWYKIPCVADRRFIYTAQLTIYIVTIVEFSLIISRLRKRDNFQQHEELRLKEFSCVINHNYYIDNSDCRHFVIWVLTSSSGQSMPRAFLMQFKKKKKVQVVYQENGPGKS